MHGLIERYRERLPFEAGDPVVSLGEGSTPLILAPNLSERVGAEVWLKVEGSNRAAKAAKRSMASGASLERR